MKIENMSEGGSTIETGSVTAQTSSIAGVGIEQPLNPQVPGLPAESRWHVSPGYDPKRQDYVTHAEDNYNLIIDPITGKEVARILRVEGGSNSGDPNDPKKLSDEELLKKLMEQSAEDVLTPEQRAQQEIEQRARRRKELQDEDKRLRAAWDDPLIQVTPEQLSEIERELNVLEQAMFDAGDPGRKNIPVAAPASSTEGIPPGGRDSGGDGPGDPEPPEPPEGAPPEHDPTNPELPNLPEGEVFQFVVTRIRQLEAMSVRKRYDPGQNESYPNLTELKLRFSQFEQFASIMEPPEIAEVQIRLDRNIELQAGLADGSTTDRDLLRLIDENGPEDPRIQNLRRQKDILSKIKNPTQGQSVALQTIEGQLIDGTEELEGPNGAKEKLRSKIKNLERGLTGSSRATLLEELVIERRRLNDYEDYKTYNILVGKINSLRGDRARQAELQQALVEFLGEQREGLETEIDIRKAIGFEKLIENELREPGQVEIEDWELEIRKKDRQDFEAIEKAETIPFEELPPFSVLGRVLDLIDQGASDQVTQEMGQFGSLTEPFQQALQSGEGVAIKLLERQVERYLFRAKEMGITEDVHNEFDELLTLHKMPEIDYYGGVRRVDIRHIQNTVATFAQADRSDRFRMYGWDRKFRGVIGYTAGRAGLRMEGIIKPRGSSAESDLSRLVGEWDSERADRKADTIAARRMYWEKSVTGYYQFKIDSDVSKNPYAAEQLRMAGDQWISYLQSGVIPKNPQDQLKEWQQFIGQLAPLAEKIYRQLYPEDAETLILHPENEGRASNEIRSLRQELKFRAEAPIAAYANAVEEAEAFDSMHQNLSTGEEGPEVWRKGYGALNGMVALALYRLENNPEWSRVFFHPEGSRGYLSTNNAAQRLMEKAVLDQLARELANWSLSDKTLDTTSGLSRLNNEITQIQAEIEANRNNAAQRLILEKARDRLLGRQKTLLQVSRNGNLNSEIALLRAVTGQDNITPDQKERWGKELEKWKNELEKATKEKVRIDINRNIVLLEGALGIKEVTPDQKERWGKEFKETKKELSRVSRRMNLGRIGLDQPEQDFLDLYGKLDDQADFQLLSPPEQRKMRKQKELEAAAAIQSAVDILNITGQLSTRSGPTIKIRNSEILKYEHKIEKLKEKIDDDDDYIKKNSYVLVYLDKNHHIVSNAADGHHSDRISVFDISEGQRTPEQKTIAAEIEKRRNVSPLKTNLETARKDHEKAVKKLQTEGKEVDKREDRVPLRMIVRGAQYAVYQAEKVWAKEADRIMKGNLNEQGKVEAIQKLCLAIIPDAWNVKKDLPKPDDRRLNLSDVLEGVYRGALDTIMGNWVVGEDGFLTQKVVGEGFKATLDVPVVVEEAGERKIVKEKLKNADGQLLYLEDIDRLPEANGMMMAYYATEEITGDTISLGYRVAEAESEGGGLLGRALRILDPAFNRFYRKDDPNYLRDRQQLQRALHAAIETQWQRHFQIKIEALERGVIGADIRKNKTGNIKDRYKIIDGNPRNNLFEFGRERLYVTGRIINHAVEVLAHADRRSRRAPDLGLYSPMQHESTYDESATEDSREFFGLIDTMSAVQAKREGSRIDFLYLKLKGARWGFGAKQRVSLESGPVEGGKQWTGLLEKVNASGDKLNRFFDNWSRSYRTHTQTFSPQDTKSAIIGRIIDETADAELEDFISTAEGVDERLKLSTENLYPDLSHYRLAQAPLWKDGVDPFLPDGTLNFERLELGRDNTLLGSDNGTSRHTSGIWSERVNQWRQDPRKGKRWYPGSDRIIDSLAKKRWIFGSWQDALSVLKGRNTR